MKGCSTKTSHDREWGWGAAQGGMWNAVELDVTTLATYANQPRAQISELLYRKGARKNDHAVTGSLLAFAAGLFGDRGLLWRVQGFPRPLNIAG